MPFIFKIVKKSMWSSRRQSKSIAVSRVLVVEHILAHIYTLSRNRFNDEHSSQEYMEAGWLETIVMNDSLRRPLY